MGVYIKSMEMPKNCEECDVKVVCKNYWKLIREQHTRPSWCPLVHVQPHGRLIDADALRYWSDDSAMIAFDYVTRSDIKAAPTIIPAEEGE